MAGDCSLPNRPAGGSVLTMVTDHQTRNANRELPVKMDKTAGTGHPTQISLPQKLHNRRKMKNLDIPMRGTHQRNLTSSIRVVRPGEFSKQTSQTAGSMRMSAISALQGVESSLWAGLFVVEPLASTGIHHHGEQETVAYVLEGEAVVRWGANGEHSTTVKAGDFLHVPSWLPHRELNPSSQNAFRWIVVRSTPEPIVVNLPETFWQPVTE